MTEFFHSVEVCTVLSAFYFNLPSVFHRQFFYSSFINDTLLVTSHIVNIRRWFVKKHAKCVFVFMLKFFVVKRHTVVNFCRQVAGIFLSKLD